MSETMENAEIPGGGTDELDTLLSEFDKSSSTRAVTEVDTPSVQPPRPQTFEERIAAAAAERERKLSEARQPKRDEATEAQRGELAELRQWAEGVEAERLAERERAEAEAVFSRASEVISEFAPWLPPDYAKQWLKNEAEIDGTLGEAWQRRHESEEWSGIARRQIDRAIRKFAKHLQKLPDPAASGDRELITRSMRGEGGPPPPPPAPNYNGMSDHEFAADVEKKYGYRPKL